MKLSRNSKFAIFVSLLLVILFGNAINASAESLDLDKLKLRLRLLQIKQQLLEKEKNMVYDINHLDTVVDGWSASYWSNQNCLVDISRPALGAVNSLTGYRTVPSGSANFNISSKNGRQINFGTDFGKNGDSLDILASTDAKVIFIGESRITGGGKSITLQYAGNDNQTCYQDYNHLSDIYIKLNQEVKKGEVLGQMGATGNVTGVHLDWTVYTYNSESWNDFTTLKDSGVNYHFIDTSSLYEVEVKDYPGKSSRYTKIDIDTLDLNDHEKRIAKECQNHTNDNAQIAFILANVKHETDSFKYFEELPSSYASSKKFYKGRGYIQLTHDYNYIKYQDIFGVDIVNNPSLVSTDFELSAKIACHGVVNGSFIPAKGDLNSYINDEKVNYFDARGMINGDKNKIKNGQKIGTIISNLSMNYYNTLTN